MVHVTWLGHATVRIRIPGVASLITDPALTRQLAHLRRRVPVPGADVVGHVDAVLISHVHMDHLHGRSIRRFAGAQVVTPAGSRSLIPPTAGDVVEVRSGDRVGLGTSAAPVEIEVVHANHSSRRGPHSRVVAAPVGYVIRADGVSVYFAGDTDLFDEMADIGPVDLALVPIWGWGPTLGERHLDPERAARATELLAARRVVPIHWGTYSPVRMGAGTPSWLPNPLHAFRTALTERGLDGALVELWPGASVEVPRA